MLDNTTLELKTLLTERAVLEALSPWGSTGDLFIGEGLDPNSISEDLELKIADYLDEKWDLPLLIWILSADGVGEEAIERYRQTFYTERRSNSPRGTKPGLKFLAHPLVSRQVRLAAVRTAPINVELLSQEQALELWADLTPYMASLAFEAGVLRRTPELASATLRMLQGNYSEIEFAHGPLVRAFGFEALLDQVAAPEELSALIRAVSMGQSVDPKNFELMVTHPQVDLRTFYEVLRELDPQDLKAALHSALTLAKSEEILEAAARLYELPIVPLDGEFSPQLAVNARNARRNLRGDEGSFAAMVRAEVAYRIHREPYRRLIQNLNAPSAAFSSDEVSNELARSIREATDAELLRIAVAKLADEWLKEHSSSRS